MENRLELNKRPVYELPDEVLVGNYDWRRNKPTIPSFEPDICIGAWGKSVGEVQGKGEKTSQIWIKTDNEKLINFIKNNNLKEYINSIGTLKIECWKFKKIILKEFYEVKHGE